MKKFFLKLILSTVTFLVLLGSCGCSNKSEDDNSEDNKAPTELSYSLPNAVYTLHERIADNIPTVSGIVTSYSIDPALPSGLTIDSDTGIISGTPITLQLATVYTVTASNEFGYATTYVAITIDDNPPSNLLYYSQTAVYTINKQITNNTPTVTGSVSSYLVDPPLPSGLTIDSLTGVISGTPTELQTATDYTITVSNQYGFTKDIISITVNDTAPTNLTYPLPTVVLAKGVNIGNIASSTSGTPTSWSVSPSLPDGLTLDSSNGNISGSPTTTQSNNTYTITAINSGGFCKTNLSIIIVDSMYVCGCCYNDAGVSVAGYWLNGTWVNFSNPYGSSYNTHASSLTLSGTDVYVLGTCNNSSGVSIPGYWLNGTWTVLTNSYGGGVGSIAISSGNVYACGYCNLSSGLPVAGYWVNETWNALSNPYDGSTIGLATYSIAVSGSSVYVSGFSNNGSVSVPGYWLNGSWTALTNPYGSSISGNNISIQVSGSNVYTAGFCYNSFAQNKPGYWLDGSWNDLSVDFGGMSIFLYLFDSNVYVAGFRISNSGHYLPGYWLNGAWVALDMSTYNYGQSSSITVAGGDVFVSGVQYNDSSLFLSGFWVDGNWIPLVNPYGSSYSSQVGSVIVNTQ